MSLYELKPTSRGNGGVTTHYLLPPCVDSSSIPFQVHSMSCCSLCFNLKLLIKMIAAVDACLSCPTAFAFCFSRKCYIEGMAMCGALAIANCRSNCCKFILKLKAMSMPAVCKDVRNRASRFG